MKGEIKMDQSKKKANDLKIVIIAVTIVAIIEIAVGIAIIGAKDTLINGSIQSIITLFNR